MLSATIIAKDEADRIGRCLAALHWVDEIIVVVDDRSTDATGDIAIASGARVMHRRFEGFSNQRQWADEQASGDWILSIDCDEVVTPELAEEIKATLAAPAFDAYLIPHLDYMFGRWIRRGGWYPQYHTRLYRAGHARWERDIHERVIVSSAAGTLQHPILHFSHKRVADWVKKMERYTSTEAETMFRAGLPMHWIRILAEPPLYFAYKYVVQQGWRDGMHGLALAMLLGCYRLVRNLKLWDLKQAARGPRERDDCPPTISRS